MSRPLCLRQRARRRGLHRHEPRQARRLSAEVGLYVRLRRGDAREGSRPRSTRRDRAPLHEEGGFSPMTSRIGSLPPLLPTDGPWKSAPQAASFAEREFQVAITTRLIEDQNNYWVAAGGGPMYSVLLARRLYAPNALYVTEDGIVG